MVLKTPLKRVLFTHALRTVVLGLFVVFTLGAMFTLRTPVNVSAATSSNLNFQARLQSNTGAIVPDGNYNIEFKLYDVSSGGTALWTETRQNSATQGVTVRNGYVTVNLGSVTSFPGTINWDQDLWLTMNIGGTSTGGSPTYDGEMNPRLKLTAVPYAFSAGQLAKLTGANTSTLNFATQTGARAILLPDEAGTICIQNSANCGFLTGAAAAGSFVQLQGGTPGTAQTGHFNISGTGIAGILQAATINATTTYQLNGTAGSTTTCSGGNVLQNAVVQGGIITGGSCVANGGGVSGVTLQGSTPGTPDTGNFNISGTGIADILQGTTRIQTPLLDTASAGVLSIGTTNATQINLNKNVVVAASQYITLVGGITSTRPVSPADGTLYYDSTTKTLLVYANSRWQSYGGNAATKIVAMGTATGCSGSSPVASSAPDGADYISTSCTSSQTTIASAITALPAGGGTVYLMEGTYIIDGTIALPSNVRLTGSGRNTIIKLKDGINAAIDAISDTGTTNIEVSNLRLDGNKTNNSSGTQRGINFAGVGSGTGTSAVPGAQVTNVYIKDFRTIGIYFNNSPNSLISGNTVVNNGTSSASDVGISVVTGGYVNITGNIIQGTTGFGINASSDYNTISNNTIEGSVNYGIAAGGSSITISGNTIRSNAHGIDAGVNGLITGNIISGNTGRGVYISSAGMTVTGNNIVANSIGLYAVSGSRSTVTGNTFTQNTTQAISWLSGSSNVISSNKFYDNAAATSGSTIDLSANAASFSITNNDITDTAGSGYAINLASNVDYIYLSGNTYSGTGATSINDLSNTTIYANQANSSGALVNRNPGGLTVGKLTATTTLDIQGALRTTTLSTPGAPTLARTGTAGTTTYGYKISALDGLGETLASTETTNATGFATLDGTHYFTITWNPVGGAVQYKVYRTTSGGTPSSTGLIGTVAGNVQTFTDTGIAASGAVASSNTTGNMSVAGSIQGGSSLTLGTSSSQDASIIFRNATNANTVTLVTGATSTSYTTVLPAAIGAAGQCLSIASVVSSTQTLGYATCGGGGGGGVTLQGSTPGTPDTGNFNVSGTGIAAVFLASDFDRASAGTLTFGNTNATTINIGTNAAAHTIAIGNGAAAQTVTVGSANSTSTLTLQSGSGGININGAMLSNSYLSFSGATTTSYITPVGSSVLSKISIANYDPGNFGQVLAFGIPSTSAFSTSRVLSVFDGRTGAHQPSLAVFSPDESQVFGFSWDGSNSTPLVKSSTTGMTLQANSINLMTLADVSGTAVITIGVPGTTTSQLQFTNATNGNTVILQGGVTTTSYKSVLPAAIGTTGQCLYVASVASSTQTLGYTTCGTSTGVTLQGTTPGTPDTGNFNISGTGIAAALQANSLDRAAAGTLSIGTVTASAITIGGNSVISTLNGQLSLSGTSTLQSKLILGGTVNSSLTTSQYGLQNNVSIQPAGASLADAYGFTNNVTLTGTSVNVTQLFGGSMGISTSGTYTGTLSAGFGLNIAAPSISGTNKLANYYGINIQGNSGNSGNTTGTINNYQLRVAASTAAAASGGTLNNYSAWLQVPTGAGAGTTNNYGLYIQGAGGGSTVYSFYNASTAASYFAGAAQIAGTLTLGTVSSTTGSIVFNNSSNGNTATLQGGATSTSYTTVLPAAIGTAGQCVYVASAASGTQTLGYTTCGGGGGSGVTLQATTPGTADTGNFNVSGTGIAAILQAGTSVKTALLDTISAGALSIGTTNATSIVLAQNTTVSAGKTLTVGDATNYVKFDSNFATTGRIYGGTGRPTRQIKLAPEFSGSVFTADGSSNIGFMTSDFVSGLSSGQGYKHNFYAWATDQAGAQDYDINVMYQLPSDFDGFVASSFKFWVYADSLTSTDTQVMITDAAGTSCYASLQSIVATSAATWQQKTLSDPANGCTFAANDMITISIKPKAITPQTDFVKIGEFQFDYKAKF